MEDLHVHTRYSDGVNTPREMVEAAIKRRLETLGFSDHAYTPFDETYCMKKDKITDYLLEITSLKHEYSGAINLRLGLEQDYYSVPPTIPVDYLIGSVHYVSAGKEYLPVDESEEIFRRNVEKYFNGEYFAFAEAYFDLVGDVINKTGAGIVGHFDLITKFNEKNKLFDENDPRYVCAWKRAADKLLSFSPLFEINTGAVYRGYKRAPYPSMPIYEYLKSKGAKFILSSDSHSALALGYMFEELSSFVSEWA